MALEVGEEVANHAGGDDVAAGGVGWGGGVPASAASTRARMPRPLTEARAGREGLEWEEGQGAEAADRGIAYTSQ